MRVIGGKYKRRKLLSVGGDATRPMLGRMRQTLFDILQDDVAGKVFADLYAGTGAVGIEALSRGARSAVFVEASAAAAKVIRRNLGALEAAGSAQVRVAQVKDVIGSISADVFFLGPPYEAAREYAATLAALAGSRAEWVIAQHGAGLALADRYGGLERVRVVKVGRNRLSMFRCAEAPEAQADPSPGPGPATPQSLPASGST